MAADMQSGGFLDDLVVVLMRTTHPGNIGAVARACKNMGLSEIRLVAPEDFPSEVATRRASGAEDLLQHAQVFQSLDEAVGDCHCIVGASARSRSMVWPLMNPRDCAQEVYSRHNEAKEGRFRVALLFGQEASGLSNDELHRCNLHVNIPANPDYASLNLAMAVQVISYEMRMTYLLDSDSSINQAQTSPILNAGNDGWDVSAATVDDVEGMISHLEEALVTIGYHDPDNPRVLMTRLRRLFQRCGMDRMEVNIFRGISKAILKRHD